MTELGQFQAFLFDMDGTLINSNAAAERIWGNWADAHGVDRQSFLNTIHGSRAVDTISKLNLPGVDAQVEAQKVNDAETVDTQGIVEIPGAIDFLKSLPKGKWALVTSAPIGLATARLKSVGILLPEVVITAAEVSRGKPDPECYLLAAKTLGVDIQNCLVFEDAKVGLQAGLASGAKVMAITETHTHALSPEMSDLVARADFRANHYQKLKVKVQGELLLLSLL